MSDEPPRRGDETTQLLGFLGYLREAVIRKVSGLDEDAARAPQLPSGWHLVGLVHHLACVERFWRDCIVDGGPDVGPWSDDDPDAEWRVEADRTVAEVVEFYRDQATRTDARFRDADLDGTVAHPDSDHDLRWVLIHLVEETARHAGHADAARELLDGSVGE